MSYNDEFNETWRMFCEIFLSADLYRILKLDILRSVIIFKFYHQNQLNYNKPNLTDMVLRGRGTLSKFVRQTCPREVIVQQKMVYAPY